MLLLAMYWNQCKNMVILTLFFIKNWQLRTPNKFHFKIGILNIGDEQDRKFCMINNEISQHAPTNI
jgi:hypothetical protein